MIYGLFKIQGDYACITCKHCTFLYEGFGHALHLVSLRGLENCPLTLYREGEGRKKRGQEWESEGEKRRDDEVGEENYMHFHFQHVITRQS